MNLPQTAIEFLDAFRGFLYTRPSQPVSRDSGGEKGDDDDGGQKGLNGLVLEGLQGRTLPMIHVYCFEKEVEGDEDAAPRKAIARCVAALGGPDAPVSLLPRDKVDVHVVRYVSPQKPMLCLSFRLPLEVANAPPLQFQ
jgi:tRNA (guanine37-N1)-methyltransferase